MIYAFIVTEHDLSKHVTHSSAKKKYFARQCYNVSTLHLWSNVSPRKPSGYFTYLMCNLQNSRFCPQTAFKFGIVLREGVKVQPRLYNDDDDNNDDNNNDINNRSQKKTETFFTTQH
jgi:hypothetical protein